jgi:hypothetical protein
MKEQSAGCKDSKSSCYSSRRLPQLKTLKRWRCMIFGTSPPPQKHYLAASKSRPTKKKPQYAVVHVDGILEDWMVGALRILMSSGNILYSISRSFKILIISWSSSSLLSNLSPMSWKLIVWRHQMEILNLFVSSTSRRTTMEPGYQCSFLLSR